MKLLTMTTDGWPANLIYHLWIDAPYQETCEALEEASTYIRSLGHSYDCQRPTMIRSPAVDLNTGGRFGQALYRAKIFCSSPDPLMMIKLAGRVPD